MKAVLCKALGPPESLVVETVPDPQAGPGQVVIDVAACGVNFPDTLIIEGKYQARPDLPFSPGGEVAGTISAVGDGVDQVAVGDRVIAICGWGGYAEKLAVDARQVIPIPDALDDVTAAGLILAYGTSWHALKQRAQLKAGETLLVLGAAGGVGLAAVELGKVVGARVIAAASTDEKLAVAREHGADELINYSRDDLKESLKSLTDGKGVDVVYDPVGGDFFETAVRSMAWNGRALVVGFASGEIPRLPVNLLLLKGCSVVGVFWGTFMQREPRAAADNHRELIEMVLDGRLKPLVSETFPLQRAAEAMRVLTDRKVRGKVVITTL